MEPDNQQRPTPALPTAPIDPISELKTHHIADWMLLLDRLASAEPPAPVEQIDACNAEIDRLTQALQAEAGQQ